MFGEHEPEQEESEMDEEQKHANWVENCPYLYDHIVVHKLKHPLMTVQWIPDPIVSSNPSRCLYRLVGGTAITDSSNNYLNVYSVDLPKAKFYVDLAKPPVPNPENAKAKTHSVKLEKRFKHQGEVNKCAYMPQDPNVIATKTNEGLINLYKLDAPSDSGPFKQLHGLQVTGFPLHWNPITSGEVLSSGIDGKIAIWNHLDSEPTQRIDLLKCAVNVTER